MKIGVITCSYFMRIYGYKMPDPFSWGEMTAKYQAEFGQEDFLKLAREIRAIGFDHMEIWEPTFSHMVYTAEQATAMAGALREIGFLGLVYCIGGWGAKDVDQVEKAYRFAKALGASVVTGCVKMADTDIILPVMEKWGKELGIRYAIENHPSPNLESPQQVAEAVRGYETVGANLDTGIYNMQGYDVLAAAELLRDKIFHVHCKDTAKGGHGCLPVGDGDAPMAAVLCRLREWGYNDMISVEFEFEGDPTPGLVRSLAYMRGILA